MSKVSFRIISVFVSILLPVSVAFCFSVSKIINFFDELEIYSDYDSAINNYKIQQETYERYANNEYYKDLAAEASVKAGKATLDAQKATAEWQKKHKNSTVPTEPTSTAFFNFFRYSVIYTVSAMIIIAGLLLFIIDSYYKGAVRQEDDKTEDKV